MYGVCTSCPGAETLEVLLQNELDDMTIEYYQWVVTDRATLTTVVQQSDKFIENLLCKMPEMTRYHFTSRHKARYLEVKRKSAIRPVHNFGRLLRELFIYAPRCHKGILTGHTINQFFILSLFISKINTCKLCPSV
jgi:hypothetical protein